MTQSERLELGYILPVNERGLAGATPRWSDILALARRAEDVGFDSIWVPDHLLFRFPDSEPGGAWEAWTLVSALSASTSRVKIGTWVMCTSFRPPALVAKLVDTADEISGGRIVLGLGAGWHEPEFEAFGYPFDHRVSRFEEAIQIISPLLRDGHVDFAGRYYQARDCELRPRGSRAGGARIMVGSTGPRMLRLAARHAHLVNSWARTFDLVEPYRETVEAACRDEGRDPVTLPRTHGVVVNLPHLRGFDGGHGGSEAYTGTPADLAQIFGRYAAAGVTELHLAPEPRTVESVDALAPVVEATRARGAAPPASRVP